QRPSAIAVAASWALRGAFAAATAHAQHLPACSTSHVRPVQPPVEVPHSIILYCATTLLRISSAAELIHRLRETAALRHCQATSSSSGTDRFRTAHAISTNISRSSMGMECVYIWSF